jgi:hypothetical protein
MEPGSRRTPKTPEAYFADWISWFKKRGIVTEIRKDGKGAHLWREGIEATEKNNRKK